MGEKNLVGYKYYEKYGMKPMFPFGYGLSYSSFKITPNFTRCVSHESCTIDIKVSSNNIHATGLNWKYTGIASVVLQVYIGFNTQISNDFLPVKELRAFRKVWYEGTYNITLGQD